ncbi:mechanosensitive ion channel family protein [Sandaracinobacteroides sp. A072]|uniref:mechanosensitive ion channel family protein n=1 Tax=Sandaracinobacteroides sp. A072 TaxID=3461146 RepID=UPI004041CFA8
MLDDTLFTIAGRKITILMLAEPLVILAITIGVAIGVGLIFTRLRRRAQPDRAPLLYVVGQVLRYIVIFGGLFATISALGLNLSSLSIFAGALGVGIGLGLQDVVRNFVSGLILLFDRSIEVGDFIELDNGSSGLIVHVGPRATTITTNDNVDILVPNSHLLSSELINWTRNHATRRVHIPFSVAYGTDKEKVREAALEAARSVPFTHEDDRHRTQVWLTGFGDSALEFELVVWPTLDAVKRPGSMYAAYRWALDDALRRHCIEIPFPQHDIRIRSLFGEEGEKAVRILHPNKPDTGRPPEAPEKPAVAESPNDAAADILRGS